MQAETTFAITLKSRSLFPFPQAVTLGAAVVAFAVFVSAQYGNWRPAQQEQEVLVPPTHARVDHARADHPWGALIHFAPEAAPQPARKPLSTSPWTITRGPLLDIDPDKAPVTQPQPQIAQRDMGVEREAPLPPRRPQAQSTERRDAPAVAAAPAPDNRGVFERLFNIQPTERTALAYATPQDGAVSNGLRGATQMPMGYADKLTAVYDISAKAVIMPNGEKLEAHSGLGPLLDDPNRVHVKNRGATPPNVYELSLREQLFHGVRALRLNPVNGGDMFGRDGMLAHTYMLGPNGDSNGCVSFKDYDRFLRAFLNGDVKRLIVVQKLT
jgi:hypothetical protein